jgi:hypothetical protein
MRSWKVVGINHSRTAIDVLTVANNLRDPSGKPTRGDLGPNPRLVVTKMTNSPEWWFGLAIFLSGGAVMVYGGWLMGKAYGLP